MKVFNSQKITILSLILAFIPLMANAVKPGSVGYGASEIEANYDYDDKKGTYRYSYKAKDPHVEVGFMEKIVNGIISLLPTYTPKDQQQK